MCGCNKLYFREIALKSTQSCKRINYISMKLIPAMEEIANNILENIFVSNFPQFTRPQLINLTAPSPHDVTVWSLCWSRDHVTIH